MHREPSPDGGSTSASTVARSKLLLFLTQSVAQTWHLMPISELFFWKGTFYTPKKGPPASLLSNCPMSPDSIDNIHSLVRTIDIIIP